MKLVTNNSPDYPEFISLKQDNWQIPLQRSFHFLVNFILYDLVAIFIFLKKPRQQFLERL